MPGVSNPYRADLVCDAPGFNRAPDGRKAFQTLTGLTWFATIVRVLAEVRQRKWFQTLTGLTWFATRLKGPVKPCEPLLRFQTLTGLTWFATLEYWTAHPGRWWRFKPLQG